MQELRADLSGQCQCEDLSPVGHFSLRRIFSRRLLFATSRWFFSGSYFTAPAATTRTSSNSYPPPVTNLLHPDAPGIAMTLDQTETVASTPSRNPAESGSSTNVKRRSWRCSSRILVNGSGTATDDDGHDSHALHADASISTATYTHSHTYSPRGEDGHRHGVVGEDEGESDGESANITITTTSSRSSSTSTSSSYAIASRELLLLLETLEKLEDLKMNPEPKPVVVVASGSEGKKT